jgi:peptide-methionine (R)-S-oxide reductase
MSDWKDKDDAYWRAKLTPEQYEVCRRKGTERPFSGEYNSEKRAGTYVCACCGTALFDAEAKYDSGSGWPSFFRPVDAAHIEEDTDVTRGMVRTEILCAECGGHLGHVFPDGPQPTGLRYCVNSLSLKLEPRED